MTKKIIWRVVYGVLALATLIVGTRTYNIVAEATKPQFFAKPGMGDYRVLQSHEGGYSLEVEHNGKTYVLDYKDMTTTDDDARKGPYPYEPGETLRLQVMCVGPLPLFYKELEDGTGERKYELGDIWHANTEDFCKGD